MKSQLVIYMVSLAVVLSCSATKVSASPDTAEEKAPLSKRQNGEPEASIRSQWGYKNRIGSKKSGCQTDREAADSWASKGIEILFTTMKHELATGHDSSNIKTINEEIFSAWRELLYIVFCRIPKSHPLSCAKNQKAVVSLLKDAVNFMFMGLVASSSRTSSSTPIQLQGFRNATDCRLKELAIDIQTIIRGCKKYSPQTIISLYRSQNDTVFNALSCNQNIFGGIQVIQDTISCEAEAGHEDGLSLITDFHRKATVGSRGWVHSIFNTLELLFPAHPRKY